MCSVLVSSTFDGLANSYVAPSQGNLLKLFKTSSMAASDVLVPTMGMSKVATIRIVV